jgi:excisionase family DNA binding protein
MSLEQTAECMSVSVKTIRRWIAAGTLPAYRCGKRAIRIKLDDLEAAPRQIPVTSMVRWRNPGSTVIDCPSWPNRPTSSIW